MLVIVWEGVGGLRYKDMKKTPPQPIFKTALPTQGRQKKRSCFGGGEKVPELLRRLRRHPGPEVAQYPHQRPPGIYIR